MSRAFYLFLLITFNIQLFGQESINLNDNSDTMFELGFEYGFYQPQEDLKSYFGRHTGVGGHMQFLTKKNIYLGGQLQYIFGNQVQVDAMSLWYDEIGNVYGLNFSFADILTKQRGLTGQLYIGKLFPIKSARARMGIKTTLGVGFLQHKLFIQEDPEAFMPQLDKSRLYIFDHKTNGVSLHQFVGFHYLDNNRMLNFYAGFDFFQGFTQNRRDYNVDLGIETAFQRVDIATGFKIGWILPFYINDRSENIWY